MAAISGTVALAATAASAAYGAYSSNAAGRRGSHLMQQQAAQTALDAGREAGTRQFQADEVMRIATDKAEKTLVLARQFRSSQTVMAAASGFVVDAGTSQALMDETDKLARADALSTMYDAVSTSTGLRLSADSMIEAGANRSSLLYEQASGIKMQAQAQTISQLGQMVSSLSSMYGKFPSSSPSPHTTTGIPYGMPHVG